MPAPKSTTLEDVAKRPREYPRPAKVEPVATEQEPPAGMAGAFFVGGFARLRLPHTYPLPDERSVSPSSRRAPWGRTGAAGDRAVPGTMMARPGVEGQVGTGRSPGVSAGRRPYNRAIATEMIRESLKGGILREGAVVLVKFRVLRRAGGRSGGLLEDAAGSPLPLRDTSTLSLHRASVDSSSSA